MLIHFIKLILIPTIYRLPTKTNDINNVIKTVKLFPTSSDFNLFILFYYYLFLLNLLAQFLQNSKLIVIYLVCF